jgi:Ca2+-binding EF-hand superfamily protein
MAELPADLKAQLKELFDAADTDGSGSIDAKEMKGMLAKMGIEPSDEDFAKGFDTFCNTFDVNKDGTMSFDEMCQITAQFM